MRAFLRLLLQSIFVLATVPFLLLLSFKFNGLSANYIKEILVKADAYKALTTSQHISLTGISSGYVRTKIEKLVDDTNSWLTKSAEPPVLSFSDIPPAYRAEATKALTQLKKNAKIESTSDPLSFPLEKTLTPLKNFYWWATTGFGIITLIIVVCLAGVYFLSENLKESLKGLGTMFLIAFFWNIVSTGLVLLLEGVMRGLILESPDLPSALKDIYKIFATTIFETAKKLNLTALGVLLVLSLVLFIASGRVKLASKSARPV